MPSDLRIGKGGVFPGKIDDYVPCSGFGETSTDRDCFDKRIKGRGGDELFPPGDTPVFQGLALNAAEDIPDELLFSQDNPPVELLERIRGWFTHGLLDELPVIPGGLTAVIRDHAENTITEDQRIVVVSSIGGVAAVGVRFRTFGQAGTHRIEVDIAADLQEVTVTVDKESLIAALKQMATVLCLDINVGGVGTIEIVHERAEVGEGRFDDDVVMIPHEHVAMKEDLELLACIPKILCELHIVCLAQVDLLAIISPGGNVVEGTGILDAECSGHGYEILPDEGVQCQALTPLPFLIRFQSRK